MEMPLKKKKKQVRKRNGGGEEDMFYSSFGKEIPWKYKVSMS